MKTADKIYTPFVDLGEDGLCQAPIWWDKNKQDENPECKGTIEYIRKDALLEWAKKKANVYKYAANIRRSFEMVIRKIESL